MQEIQVVAAIIEHNGKILCMQRGNGKNKETAFKWEFPGGKVDAGETPEQAIIREIQEELEIDIKVNSVFGHFTHTYADFILQMTCFRCSTDNFDIKQTVHIDSKWLEVKDIISLDWAPGDLPVAKALASQN